MQAERWRALVLERNDTTVRAEVREVEAGILPEGDLLLAVAYSDLNYKDGLALAGRPGIIRSYPMIPGIDLVGTVLESASPRFAVGDTAIATGFGLGERHPGGYTQRQRLRSDWALPLPAGLSPHAAVAIGTAGLTAMLAVMALESAGLESGTEVLVTGAVGGVGSCAVALLAAAGYRPVASTGRPQESDYLKALGATAVIGRDEVAAPSDRPLESARWAGAIDTVGAETLAGVLRTLQPGAAVAACGNAAGNGLHTTVLPFILRGVALLGIDSNYCPLDRRAAAWSRLAEILPHGTLEAMTETVPLAALPEVAQRILQGQVRGRTVVDVNA